MSFLRENFERVVISGVAGGTAGLIVSAIMRVMGAANPEPSYAAGMGAGLSSTFNAASDLSMGRKAACLAASFAGGLAAGALALASGGGWCWGNVASGMGSSGAGRLSAYLLRPPEPKTLVL